MRPAIARRGARQSATGGPDDDDGEVGDESQDSQHVMRHYQMYSQGHFQLDGPRSSRPVLAPPPPVQQKKADRTTVPLPLLEPNLYPFADQNPAAGPPVSSSAASVGSSSGSPPDRGPVTDVAGSTNQSDSPPSSAFETWAKSLPNNATTTTTTSTTVTLAKDDPLTRHVDIVDPITDVATTPAQPPPSHADTMDLYNDSSNFTNTNTTNNTNTTRDLSTQAALDAAYEAAFASNLFDHSGLVDTQPPDGSHERALPVGDTGATNFGLDVHGHDESQFSQASYTEGLVTLGRRGSWRNETDSQIGDPARDSVRNPIETPARAVRMPETPATNYTNPFAKHPRAYVLAASQLFQATPALPSSVRRGISPTSSRPSPNMLRDNTFTSPSMALDTPIRRPVPPPPPSSSPPPHAPSSPLQVLTSFAPNALGDPAPAAASDPTQPDKTIPASPPSVPRRSARRHGPMTEYEPTQISQEQGEEDPREEFEPNLMYQTFHNHGQANRGRRAAARGLSGLLSDMPGDEGGRPPKRLRRNTAQRSDPALSIVPRSSDESPHRKKSLGAVRSGTDTTPGPVIRDSQDSRPSARPEPPVAADKRTAASSNEACVPATSPVNSPTPAARPPPRLDDGRVAIPPSPLANSRFETIRKQQRRPVRTYGRGARRPARPAQMEMDPGDSDADELAAPDAPALAGADTHQETMASSPPPPSANAASSMLLTQPTAPAPSSDADADGKNSSSSLTELSSTPSLSDTTSAETLKSSASTRTSAHNSPARESRGRPSLPRLALKNKTTETRSSSRAKQTPVNAPMSTDELAWSPAGLERSVIAPNKSLRADRSTSRRPASTVVGNALFAGMVFAISFQNPPKGESQSKCGGRAATILEIEASIVRRGGKVIADGFHELFEIGSMKTAGDDGPSDDSSHSVRLRRQFEDAGFTALIADGHSRKIKYMEALALGIPCISHVWVTKCVTSNTLIPWRPYLLCSGQSALLGDAVASRSLAPYPAASARLVDVLARRELLLGQHRILLVVRQSREDKVEAYVFLARAMGATVVVARTPDQARHTLAQANSLGRPYDWLYFEGAGRVEDLVQAQTGSVGKGRKRKRGAAVGDVETAAAAVAVDGTVVAPRALSNELIIQSLILGQVIDQEDWAAHAG